MHRLPIAISKKIVGTILIHRTVLYNYKKGRLQARLPCKVRWVSVNIEL